MAMAFSLIIGGIIVSEHVSGIEPDIAYRARSVRYALDGTAHEDRLGSGKKRLKVTFSGVPGSVWETIKSVLNTKTIAVSGQVGSSSISGNFRLTENTIPTPVLVIHADGYYTNTFSVTLEEI